MCALLLLLLSVLLFYCHRKIKWNNLYSGWRWILCAFYIVSLYIFFFLSISWHVLLVTLASIRRHTQAEIRTHRKKDTHRQTDTQIYTVKCLSHIQTSLPRSHRLHLLQQTAMHDIWFKAVDNNNLFRISFVHFQRIFVTNSFAKRVISIQIDLVPPKRSTNGQRIFRKLVWTAQQASQGPVWLTHFLSYSFCHSLGSGAAAHGCTTKYKQTFA